MPQAKTKKKKKTYYITTPIYYVNDVPHIGHAYTTIACDTLARHKRLQGYDTFLLTGTDEHGQKIEQAASDRGETPKQLADRVMLRFQDLWERLGISHNRFIRTTEPDHLKGVNKIFRAVQKKGDIYLGFYEDWYCISDEAYWTDLQLVEGKCPTCGRPVEKIKEESYFFRMSRYQKPLLKYLKSNPDFIRPLTRRNEVIRFVEGGLRDLSVSRVGFKWGIPVPGDPRHVIYVWFDALTNYLSGIGFGKNPARFSRYWPADVHVIGKDILRFHAVYWPCFLLSAGVPLPRQIFSHGWWTIDGEKMSKSKGNVVDPNLMVDRFGSDAFRYFLLREVPFGEDGDFSVATITQRFNSELANDLGNLFSRTLSMVERFTRGKIPKSVPGKIKTVDKRLSASAKNLNTKLSKLVDQKSFHLALREIWLTINLANQYIERNAPWLLAKDPGKKTRLDTVLFHLCETLRILSCHLYAFMPGTAQRMSDEIGWKKPLDKALLTRDGRWGLLKPGTAVKKGEALFPRIEQKETTEPKPPIKTGKTEPEKGRENKIMESAQAQETRLSIDDFKKLDLRTGRITNAEKVPGADKLLRLQVDIGRETRQVVAGIAEKFSPESLIGKDVILVANLKPAVIRGVESQGMILAAGEKTVEALATFAEQVEPGTRVK